jgi:hypothetical protein
LGISWIHSKTDDDDAVGEGEKKAEIEQVLHQALSSSCMGLCGSLHGDHAVVYHHELNAQIYSKTEMMVLF